MGRILLSSPAWTDIRNIDVTGWMAREQKSDTRTELVLSSPVGERVIVPGLYQICLLQEDAISNFSPLAVAPRINSQTVVPPGFDPADGPVGSSFSINGGPFSGDRILSVEICIGTRILDQEKFEFSIEEPERIDVNLPEDLKAGIYPIRIIVNGVSTLPIRWFEVVAGQ